MSAVEKKKNQENDKRKRKRKKIGNLSPENKRGSQVHKGHQRQTKDRSRRNRPSMCVVVQMEKDQENNRKKKKKSNRELKGSKSQINEAVCR